MVDDATPGSEKHEKPEKPKKPDPLQKIGAYSQQYPKRIIIFFVVLLLCLIAYRLIVNSSRDKQKGTETVVGVVKAKMQDVPVYLSALGTVTPDVSVTVRTQINGTLQRVNFKEGELVKKGDQLAQIDPRPYEAQVMQYQGALLRDQALLKNAKVDLIRYRNLYQSHAVSQQTLNTQETLVKQYEGAVGIDQGQIAAAKTNLEYCTIISPVTGRIGLSIVDEGNYVQTSDTAGIAIVNTLNPIDVVFSLPEDDIPTVMKAFHAQGGLRVAAYSRDQKTLLANGKLVAIDNQVNTQTGTLNFKSEFDNTDETLFPNQFVNIELLVNTLKNAIIIPTAAIQQGEKGPYVYRYNANKTVSYVPVKTGVNIKEDTVIEQGLSVNQIVVTEGADKLFDGAHVIVSGKSA